MTVTERTPLLTEATSSPGTTCKVFWTRWYILGVFSLVAVLQDAVWNTWGPIEHTAIILYDWTPEVVALLANYGSILYIVAFLPMVFLLERSLRRSVVLCIGLMALGTALRCGFLQAVSVSDGVFTVSCHFCSILNGISNIVVGSAPLAISAVWFPPEERVTATSIGQVFNGLGTGMSFLLASQIVRPIDELAVNGSNGNDILPDDLAGLRRDIQWYMYSNAVPAAILFFMILAYFPSAPPQPPSLSSIEERLSFLDGFRQIMTNKGAWLIAIGSSIPQGIVVAWTAMMVVNLTELCVNDVCLTQNWVNYLGIYATVTSTLAAVLVARAVDMMKERLKQTLLLLLCLGFGVFLLLNLVSVGVIQFNSLFHLQLSVTVLLLIGNSLVVSSMPVAMELAMEMCYPAGEGAVGGWVSIWFNIATVVFLSLFDIPSIGTKWLGYVLPLSCLAALPFILPLKVEYKRMKLDTDGLKPEEGLDGNRGGDMESGKEHTDRRRQSIKDFHWEEDSQTLVQGF